MVDLVTSPSLPPSPYPRRKFTATCLKLGVEPVETKRRGVFEQLWNIYPQKTETIKSSDSHVSPPKQALDVHMGNPSCVCLHITDHKLTHKTHVMFAQEVYDCGTGLLVPDKQ